MKHAPALVSILALAAIPAASAVTLYYQENWSTSVTSSMSAFGWSGYHTASATDGTTNTVTSGSAVFVASSVGSDGAAGIGAKGTGAGGVGFVFTSEFDAFDTSILHSVTFATRNNGDVAGNFQRVALRIDGAWYVTSQAYGNAAGATAWTGHEFLFTTDASAWRAVTFTPGATLSVSASTLASPLPSGTVDAAGLLLFNTGSNNVLRYDTFTINVIPEPSAFAALAGLGALGFAAMRRRGRRG
jgi:hypothetical protein